MLLDSTYDWVLRRDCTFSAKPLTLWDVWYTIAVCKLALTACYTAELTLMNSQITPITEDYSIRILSFSIIADGTSRILHRQMRSRLRDTFDLLHQPRYQALLRMRTNQIEPLLLQFIHDDFKDLV
jgi:hypothetical protein